MNMLNHSCQHHKCLFFTRCMLIDVERTSCISCTRCDVSEICGSGVQTTQSIMLCEDMQHLRDVMVPGMCVPGNDMLPNYFGSILYTIFLVLILGVVFFI